MPWCKKNGRVSAVSLPSTWIIAFDTAPWTIWSAVYTCDAVVGEISFLVEVLESVEAKEVEIPLIGVLLKIADFESERK